MGSLSFAQKQALTSACAALVAILALWGVNVPWLNDPTVQTLIVAAISSLASFIPKKPAPTLSEAYHVVEKATQAREAARFAVDADPALVRQPDEFQRPGT